MMIEGTVEVQGTVKVDNSAFVEKYLANARRAYEKEDWEEVEKYYNMVEQNAPHNMEAVFFSAYGKAMLSLSDSDYYKRDQKFKTLNKSITIISDCYEATSEDKQTVLTRISDAILKMYTQDFVQDLMGVDVGSSGWQKKLMNSVKETFIQELHQIMQKHDEEYIEELISKLSSYQSSKGGCYVATCVYGSYDCPQVWTLRRFRDDTLGATWYGRLFIRTYYAISPTLVKWFGNTKWFKKLWKGKLDSMVAKLQAKGVEDTPYADKNW